MGFPFHISNLLEVDWRNADDVRQLVENSRQPLTSLKENIPRKDKVPKSNRVLVFEFR
jgi:hypothetical protein